MAIITAAKPSVIGTTFTAFTPDAGLTDSWAANPGEVYLLVVIAGATGTTVKLDDPRTVADAPEGSALFDPDVSKIIAANTRAVMVVQSSRFLNSSTGRIGISYTSVTSLTAELFGPIPRAT